MIINPAYKDTDRGQMAQEMLTELLESDEFVSSKKPLSNGAWTLLHDRYESIDEDNFYLWRKNTGVKTEMYVKKVFYFKGSGTDIVV